MIQPLRTVHRRASIAMSIALPAVLFFGLSARRPMAQSGGHTDTLPTSAQLLKRSAGGWQRHSIETSIYGSLDSPPELYFVLRPAQPLNEPDVLLYWSAAPPANNSLPAGARLLGAVEPGQPLALPGDSRPQGYLVLYSLAHQSVEDYAALEKLP